MSPKDYIYEYKTTKGIAHVIEQIEKILDMKMRCTLEINFDGGGEGVPIRLIKVSPEDTDRLLSE